QAVISRTRRPEVMFPVRKCLQVFSNIKNVTNPINKVSIRGKYSKPRPFGRSLFWDENTDPKPDETLRWAHREVKPWEKPKMDRLLQPKQYTTMAEAPLGKIYDKKPFKFLVEEGKTYAWCTCGASKKQPFCDGSHKKLDGSSFKKTTPMFRPHRFTADETKEVWLCQCKQTSNRPFCDGTHKRDDIQERKL
ncbi:unnamed protein product, partial [Owenia fusiformis]